MGDVAATRVSGGRPALLDDPKRGFRHFGEFAKEVISRSVYGSLDPRLNIIASAPSTFGNEAVGSDGAFAVPPAFMTAIWLQILASDTLLPLCDQQKTSTNAMVYPSDQATPWGSSGVVAAWSSESQGLLTQIKPALSGDMLRLNKLLAFVPLTQELIDDALALESYLPAKTSDAVNWAINAAILNGNGNGQPLGAFNGKTLVVQAKDAGQATNTISWTNASNMIGRLPPTSHSRAIFLVNTTAIGALLGVGAGASASPITYDGDFVPGTRIPMIGRLFGRPLVPTAHNGVFSSQGDLSLVDLSFYRVLTKPQMIDETWSMDVYFDAAAGAFRARMRIDGAPTIKQVIQPPQGAATYSPFVQLAAR